MSEPTFTQVLDWIDGRLDPIEAAEFAENVATASEETAATVRWIREFQRTAAAMPLELPPEDLRSRLRNSFRQVFPSSRGHWSELDLIMDSTSMPLVGVRSTMAAEAVHLDFSDGDLTLGLDLRTTAGPEVNLTGTVRGLGAVAGVVVVLTMKGRVERTFTLDHAGMFCLDVDPGVDELWIIGPSGRTRAELDLRSSLGSE